MDSEDPKQKQGEPTQETKEGSADPLSPTESGESDPSRRKFFTGLATALGGTLVLGAAASSLDSQTAAQEVRGRILSRIREELKNARPDELAGYMKPCTSTPYGRYIK